MMDNPKALGVFNVGTGKANSFNDVANAVVKWYGKGSIKYISFPDVLKGSYQSFTEASLSDLRSIGCDYEFTSLEQGVKSYLDVLNASQTLT
jgi:ADP-L-glycero-D-manno-heptose 6-epimerase